MTTITVRRSVTALARSRAVVVCAIFVAVLTPILIGLLLERETQANDAWVTAYSVAAIAPALGIVLAIVSLIVVLYRRSRPVLRIGEEVYLPRSGVIFPVSQLATVQLWSSGDSFITLLPDHVPERVGSDPTSRVPVAAYTVRLPQGVTPQPFELAELIQAKRPEVQVDKLGSV